MIASLRNSLACLGRTASKFGRAIRGSVSVELAFYIPVAVALITGSIEFGRLGLEQVRLAGAARAGAQYGVYDLSTAGDIAGITQAARIDADDDSNSLTVSAAQVCRCSDGTVKACNETCGDGAYVPHYVEVSVSEDVALWFQFPGVPSTISLAATSSMRLR